MTHPRLQDLSFEPEIRRLVMAAGAMLAIIDADPDGAALEDSYNYSTAVDAAHSYIDQAILDASHGIDGHRPEAA